MSVIARAWRWTDKERDVSGITLNDPGTPVAHLAERMVIEDLVIVAADDWQVAVEDLAMAVDLLNRARCTDLGTDDKSWWRAQRGRLVAKWGR